MRGSYIKQWGIVIAFALFMALVMLAPAKAQVVITTPPTSCIQTCSPSLGTCVTQCY